MNRTPSNNSGVINNANVTNVLITCSPIPTYTVGGTITGLTASGLTLLDNGGNSLSVLSGATSFTFGASFPSGTSYLVTVSAQPTGETCHAVQQQRHHRQRQRHQCSDLLLANSGLHRRWNGYWPHGERAHSARQWRQQPQRFIGSNFVHLRTSFPSGTPYLGLSTQPTGETCTPSNNSGIINNANVTNVLIACTGPVNLWTWVSGTDLAAQAGVYGTKRVGAPGNLPGARHGLVSWKDSAGNFWLFGGIGYDTNGNENYLNDLWEYSGGLWTWMGGTNIIDTQGTYGTLGVGSSTNVPGARAFAVNWIDSTGAFWLFGGYGQDSTGVNAGPLNDLWKYSNGQWTWEGGPDLINGSATYGTQGTGAPGNIPGARLWASGSLDAAGNFWLFGGDGLDSAGTDGPLNDLWEYSGGQWTWVSGSNLAEKPGIYGTLGTGAASNVPGAREGQVTWFDAAGNFWLFGGNGADSTTTFGYLNDLWEYNGGLWTWMGGSNFIDAPASYGTEGVPGPTNIPGARMWSAGWTDLSGNFWLLGGQQREDGQLNDLWKYSGGEWTWVNGSQLQDQLGIYGTMGVASSSNAPGGREVPTTWVDASGNLWLFGGYGWAASGSPDSVNDLWEYQP